MKNSIFRLGLGAALAIGMASAASAQVSIPSTIPNLAGKVLTVTGPIDPSELGETLMHEHIFINFSKAPAMIPPPTNITVVLPPDEAKARVKKNPFQERDFDESLHAVMQFKKDGGGTIVDVSNFGLTRDPLALKLISRASGLNVVMGAGWYMHSMHPPDMDELSVAQLTDIIVHDVTIGAQGTHVRAGIIGEIGVGDRASKKKPHPLLPNVKKSIRAAARAARITGAPMSIHNFEALPQMKKVLDIIESEGVDLGRVVMSHTGINPDGTYDPAIHHLVFNRGAYVEYDYFGQAPLPPEMDKKRINVIYKAIKAGHADQILLSHDICSQLQLKVHGGGGYTYINDVILPGLKAKGVSDETIHQIMYENPKHILTFVAPQAPLH